MNKNQTKNDAEVIKILTHIGVLDEPTLSPEEEEMIARALDPEREFLHSVEKLFKKNK